MMNLNEDPSEPDAVELQSITTASPTLRTSPPSLTPSDEAPVRTKLRTNAIILALYLAIFLAALDSTIVATSAPRIAAFLPSASGTGYFWIGGAYLLASSAAGPIWAKCSDIWGRKPILLCAVAWFAGASALAASSISMKMLIAARALQGTAGGGLIQLVFITIADLFSVRERSLYLGLMEVVWALAGGLGPTLGGVFTQLVSWRWCFYINLPIATLAFILLVLFLNVHNPRTPLRSGLVAIDWLGTISILAVTLMLLLGLDFGGVTFPWTSAKVICLLVFGALAIGFFLLSEQKLARYPLMRLGMFRSASTAATFALAFAHGAVFMAAEYYLPLYFQSVKSAGPLRSGLLVLPIPLSEAAMAFLSGLIIHATGRYRELIWLGLLLMTIGTGLYITLHRTTSTWSIILIEVVEGAGAGLLFQPPLIAIHAMVSQADTASATATFGFVRSTATAISIVLGGVVFQNGMNHQEPSLRASGLPASLLQEFTGGDAASHVEDIKHITNLTQRRAVEDAFANSFDTMFIMYTVVASLGLLASGFLKHKDLSREHVETKTGIEKMTARERREENEGGT